MLVASLVVFDFGDRAARSERPGRTQPSAPVGRRRWWTCVWRGLGSLATAVALVLATAGPAAADDPTLDDLVTADVVPGDTGAVSTPALDHGSLTEGVPAPVGLPLDPSVAAEAPPPSPAAPGAVVEVPHAHQGAGGAPPVPGVTPPPAASVVPGVPAEAGHQSVAPEAEPDPTPPTPGGSGDAQPADTSSRLRSAVGGTPADWNIPRHARLLESPDPNNGGPAVPARSSDAPPSARTSGSSGAGPQLATVAPMASMAPMAPTAPVILEVLRQSPGAAVAVAVPSALTSAVSVAVEFGKLGHGWAGGIVFNTWLRRQLRERRMSQRQLGQLAGVDHSTISRLLNGRTPSLDTATRIARALGAAFPEGIPSVMESAPEQTALPTARVERALRGDEELEDEDVRRVMDTYLSLRVRRRRLRANGGSGTGMRH
jgi:transcriptional regulator with XRE-family HTH domain